MINGALAWRLHEKTKLQQGLFMAVVIALGFGSWPATAWADDAQPSVSTNPAPIIPVPTAGQAQANGQNNGSPKEEKPIASISSSLPTDHEVVIGAWGLGYSGMVQVPLPLAVPVGRGDQAGMQPNDKLNLRQVFIPTLGLRKWFSKRRGFDAGLGIALSTGADSATYGSVKSTVDKETMFALSARVGLPIVPVDTRHMAFMVIPEANIGFATSNVAAEFDENAPPDAKLRGFSANFGLRVGAEVHFGFMGLPRLSLQAGVGLYVTAQWASATVSNQSLSTYDVSVGLGSAEDPWDIFTGISNLSARYYF